MQRPLGITLIAVLCFVGAAFDAVLAALAVLRPAALAAILAALSPSGAGPQQMHAAMGAFLPVYYLVGIAFSAALGVGLWRLRNWARWIVIVLVAVSLAAVVGQIAQLLGAATVGAVVLTAFRVALCVFWLWYLFRARVRAAFARRAVMVVEAAI